MKPIANYRNWNNKLLTIEIPELNLSVETLRNNTYENYVFDDLKFFAIHHVPSKPDPDYVQSQLNNHPEDKITLSQAMQAWYEHDALHYLAKQPFSMDGESHIAYLEKKFNCGWLPYGEKYNPFYPFATDCSGITKELILETANLIRNYQNDLHSSLVKSSTFGVHHWVWYSYHFFYY